MQGYLATIGSGKVGFTVVSRGPTGLPVDEDDGRFSHFCSRPDAPLKHLLEEGVSAGKEGVRRLP